MTTSMALLVRGDVWHSLRANAVGTLVGVLFLAGLVWSAASALYGKLLFVHSPERVLTRLLVIVVILLLLRWVIVLGLATHAQ
jgi:hypothetical protein